MPTENPWPLNISEKVNSAVLLAWFAQFGEEGYLSAAEINTIKNALEYLYENLGSGGSELFLGTYTSLENLEAGHPTPLEGSRATITNADADDDLAVWDNGDSVWRIFEGAGAIVQDNQAKVIEFDLLTTFGTSDFAALTTGAIADKLNTLSADISPIEIPFIKISKDVTGLYQIYVLEGIGAGNTSAVTAGNVKLLVDQSISSASGGSENFSIRWECNDVYGAGFSTFPVLDQFRRSETYGIFNTPLKNNNTDPNWVDAAAGGFNVPYDCYLQYAICRITYSDSVNRDMRIFTQKADSSNGTSAENINRVALIDTRINNGVTGIAHPSVNFLTIINPTLVISAGSTIKHMAMAKGATGSVQMSIQYFFKKA